MVTAEDGRVGSNVPARMVTRSVATGMRPAAVPSARTQLSALPHDVSVDPFQWIAVPGSMFWKDQPVVFPPLVECCAESSAPGVASESATSR